ncbi:MAG: beta-ketoacyl synthase N-terminal-like domain-containing protein [Ferruginibacter sp.]
MRDIFVAADNIFSPIGFTTGENLVNLKNNISGIKEHLPCSMSEQPFYASLFDETHFPPATKDITKFEQVLIASISNALENTDIKTTDPKTVLIISTTKGNISLLETGTYNTEIHSRIALHHSAKLVAAHFNFVHTPVIVSNACISGILAMITGMRLIQSGQYENAVIAGADMITKFVLSGFQSFQAISERPCKPFDAARNGINLGEAAATVILSANEKYKGEIKIAGGSTSNDANHISGPSRTGEELFLAIKKAMKEAGLTESDIDFISAHGTATLYNDEMEAKAIALGNMQSVPVNSLKGFYGHTLGAAGIIESVIAIHSLKENIVFPTMGFNEIGVSVALNLSNKLKEANLKNVLKTASGFGGCNAAMVMRKN